LKDESFSLVSKSGQAADLEAGLKAVQSIMEEKAAAYFVLKPATEDKWLMLFYVPDGAPVRDKMMYAASRAALKEGLGASSFTVDFFVSQKSECDLAHYLGSQRPDTLDKNVLTAEEVIKREAHEESLKAMSFGKVKMTAIADIPIQISAEAQQILLSFAAKSVTSALLNLDASETIQSIPLPKAIPEDIATKLSDSMPSYVLFYFNHEADSKQASTPVFVYYCPDKAVPRQKMFYSSCKSMVLKLLENSGIIAEKRLEISDPKELTTQFVMDELYPKATEKKAIAKPKTPGKGAARLHGAAKFDHNA